MRAVSFFPGRNIAFSVLENFSLLHIYKNTEYSSKQKESDKLNFDWEEGKSLNN